MIETNMERLRANLIAEGMLMGRQEGEFLLFERLLARRFGPLGDVKTSMGCQCIATDFA